VPQTLDTPAFEAAGQIQNLDFCGRKGNAVSVWVDVTFDDLAVAHILWRPARDELNAVVAVHVLNRSRISVLNRRLGELLHSRRCGSTRGTNSDDSDSCSESELQGLASRGTFDLIHRVQSFNASAGTLAHLRARPTRATRVYF
jgi:hypothetical protein